MIFRNRQVKWLAKGQDRRETLISISTDGNVLQWSLKKGLLVSLLMQLKRGGAVSSHGGLWISCHCCHCRRERDGLVDRPLDYASISPPMTLARM